MLLVVASLFREPEEMPPMGIYGGIRSERDRALNSFECDATTNSRVEHLVKLQRHRNKKKLHYLCFMNKHDFKIRVNVKTRY